MRNLSKMALLLSIVIALASGKILANNDHIDQKIVNPLMDKAARRFEKKYQMDAIGIGLSMPGGLVRKLSLEFQIERLLTKQELCEILIPCANEFLSMINSNRELRRYLKKFPYTLENIEIVVFVLNSERRNVYHPDIGVAELSEGRLIYRTTDKSNRYNYKSIITESYEEALQAMSTNGECENLQKQGIK